MQDRIVAAARGWLGTPYRHQASLKETVGSEPEAPPPYAPDWAEAGANGLLEAARRHLLEVERSSVQPGDVLLFAWREGLPPKHCAFATSADTMIHAHDGASVAEVAFRPWWRRHLTHVFRFPGVA